MYMLKTIVLLLVICIPLSESIRCQCSTGSSSVGCYNQWCEAHDFGGKVGACAVVQKGARRLFACVRIKTSSEDSCMVDHVNGETQVRCWCRSGDYCNIDLADRIEDGDYDLKAKPMNEIVTTTLSTTTKDDFVIEQTYDFIEDEREKGAAADSDWEKQPLTSPNKERLPPVDTWPITPIQQRVTTTTIPPWRREVPLPVHPDTRHSMNTWNPRVPPPHPDDQHSSHKHHQRHHSHYSHHSQSSGQLTHPGHRAWNPPPHPPQQPERPATLPPPRRYWPPSTTTTTTSTTTTTTPTTTTSTPTTTTTSITTTKPRTTRGLPSFRFHQIDDRQPFSVNSSFRKSEVFASTTTTTTPATTTTTTQSARNEAIKSYKENQQRFKPIDVLAYRSYNKMKESHRPSTTTSTTSTTTTTSTTPTTTTTSTTTTSTTTMKPEVLEDDYEYEEKSEVTEITVTTTPRSTRPPRRKLSKAKQELYESFAKEPSSASTYSWVISLILIIISFLMSN